MVNQEATFDSHELQYTSDWDSDYSLLAGLYYYHSDEEQVVSYREWNDQLMADVRLLRRYLRQAGE